MYLPMLTGPLASLANGPFPCIVSRETRLTSIPYWRMLCTLSHDYFNGSVSRETCFGPDRGCGNDDVSRETPRGRLAGCWHLAVLFHVKHALIQMTA